MKKTKDTVILIDMDDTIYDFRGAVKDKENRGPPEMIDEEDFFYNLTTHQIALDVIKMLYLRGYDLYICSVPLSVHPAAYSQKAAAIMRDLPFLYDKIILTQNKKMIKADYLIDDNKNHAGGEYTFLHIDKKNTYESWFKIYEKLVKIKPKVDISESTTYGRIPESKL